MKKNQIPKDIPVEQLRYVMEHYDEGIAFKFKKPIKAINGNIEYLLQEFVVFSPTIIAFKNVTYKAFSDPGIVLKNMVTVENEFLMKVVSENEFEQVIKNE